MHPTNVTNSIRWSENKVRFEMIARCKYTNVNGQFQFSLHDETNFECMKLQLMNHLVNKLLECFLTHCVRTVHVPTAEETMESQSCYFHIDCGLQRRYICTITVHQ